MFSLFLLAVASTVDSRTEMLGINAVVVESWMAVYRCTVEHNPAAVQILPFYLFVDE